ncbi:hypothetical protein THAOC_35863, partial [Thalassiosira oceanica]
GPDAFIGGRVAANDSEKILVAAGGVCRARLLESLELAWAPCQRDAAVAFSQALLEDPTPGPSGRTDDPNSVGCRHRHRSSFNLFSHDLSMHPSLSAAAQAERFPLPTDSSILGRLRNGSQLFESNFRTLLDLTGATRRRGGVVSYVVGQLPPVPRVGPPGSLLGSDAKGGELSGELTRISCRAAGPVGAVKRLGSGSTPASRSTTAASRRVGLGTQLGLSLGLGPGRPGAGLVDRLDDGESQRPELPLRARRWTQRSPRTRPQTATTMRKKQKAMDGDGAGTGDDAAALRALVSRQAARIEELASDLARERARSSRLEVRNAELDADVSILAKKL